MTSGRCERGIFLLTGFSEENARTHRHVEGEDLGVALRRSHVAVEPPLAPQCRTWDRDSSLGIALLVPDDSDIAEVRLDDALYQLRRARKNCRAGRLDLAGQDYDVLQRAHPFPQQASSTASRHSNP